MATQKGTLAKDTHMKDELKRTLVGKIKAKYGKEFGTKLPNFETLITAEIELFVTKSACTQETLLQLDHKIKKVLEQTKSQPKQPPKEKEPANPLTQKPDPEKTGKEPGPSKDVWTTLSKYNAKLYEKDQLEYANYVSDTKQMIKSELTRQVEQKKKLEMDRIQYERGQEAEHIEKAIEKERHDAMKERSRLERLAKERRDAHDKFQSIRGIFIYYGRGKRSEKFTVETGKGDGCA